ncbi:GntR family transcriptional regulator [Allorhizobium sp. BGMRC 0089]|uniref:GntR family transcriptional regulator n=1 Tax=Allorhizobium sonneratiae TaxID=2934936 RepID=UPI002033489B|nr:GntR family transcriptional regulator [Allorhizobium sonneratiae]MCM2292845.1 GntR family transcriptional regulator [Allorhizobium sonneratiae]
MPQHQMSLSHLAYRQLEQMIVTLKLLPGSTITERELILMAGYGRTPVREAIQKLQWQGLIEVRPRVGLRISRIHPEHHQQIMMVRAELEPLAASLAARHATADQRTTLDECADAMENASRLGDLDAFLSADKYFDEVLESACPNGFLISALQPLQTHSRRIWYAGATVDKLHVAAAMHIAVIRAVKSRDHAQAQETMRALIGHIRQS